MAGPVLVHQVQVGVARDFPGKEGQDVLGVRDVARKHQVPNQETAPGQAPLVDLQVAHLAVHLAHRRLVDLPVVAHLRVLVGRLGVAVLHVGHVDVDHAVEQGQRLGAVVAAGIVDERQAQSPASGDGDRGQDLGDHVARGDQVDVVASLGLERQHHRGEFLRLHLASEPLLADLPVLAEDAAQAAPGEEDGPRARPTPQRVLLAVVGP